MRHKSRRHGVPDGARSLASTDPAAALVEAALGEGARQYFRSPERRFPLHYNGLFFSISRGDSVTALAVSTKPVGIDVERRPRGEATSDLLWALTEDEQHEVARDGSEILTEIWTAKEAAGKALGVGLQAAPHRIATVPDQNAPCGRVVSVPTTRKSLVMTTRGWWFGEHHIRVASA